MTELMLTAGEIERLTGRKRPGAQQRWLQRHRLRYRLNDRGEVIVARAIAEKFLGIERPVDEEPDLDWPAMRRAGMVSSRGEA